MIIRKTASSLDPSPGSNELFVQISQHNNTLFNDLQQQQQQQQLQIRLVVLSALFTGRYNLLL